MDANGQARQIFAPFPLLLDRWSLLFMPRKRACSTTLGCENRCFLLPPKQGCINAGVLLIEHLPYVENIIADASFSEILLGCIEALRTGHDTRECQSLYREIDQNHKIKIKKPCLAFSLTTFTSFRKETNRSTVCVY